MGDLLVSLLLPALAIAVNPIPIIAAVTLLMTGHGRRNIAAFLASVIVVMAADGLLTLFLLGQNSSSTSSKAHGWVQLALGLVFVGLFLVQWRSKPVPLGEEPGWMKLEDAVDTHTQGARTAADDSADLVEAETLRPVAEVGTPLPAGDCSGGGARRRGRQPPETLQRGQAAREPRAAHPRGDAAGGSTPSSGTECPSKLSRHRAALLRNCCCDIDGSISTIRTTVPSSGTALACGRRLREST